MDHRPQPELSYLHKKTYARFYAAALQYNFMIQKKPGSGVPFHLLTTSPFKIMPWLPTIQSSFKLNKKIGIYAGSNNSKLPKGGHRHLNPITKLNWKISTATSSSIGTKLLGSTALTEDSKSPLKYHQPVICCFWQRLPDLPVKDQIQRLQENYC